MLATIAGLKDTTLLKSHGFIDGAWTDAKGGGTFPVENPATGETIAVLPDMGADETRAAIEAANTVGLPYVVTASFDTAGRTMMGLAPADFARTMAGKDPRPEAFGSNCGVGASDLLVAALDMTANADGVPVVCKANAGIPKVKGDEVVYTGTVELMADYARLAVNIGARIVGGCCGNTAEHVAAMRDAIDRHNGGERPTKEEIIERLGPLVSPPSEAAGGDRPQRRRRRA